MSRQLTSALGFGGGVFSLALLVLLALSAGCGGTKQRPDLPAPEYEAPQVMPWDAGAAPDPLDEGAEEWLDEEDEADEGAAAPEDAGLEASPSNDPL